MYFCVLCIVCVVTFPVLFVCIRVLNNCHRVATQLQLNIYHIMREYVKVLFLSNVSQFPNVHSFWKVPRFLAYPSGKSNW